MRQAILKYTLTIILFFVFHQKIVSQVIPDSMRAGWSYAGLQDFYIDTANVADVTAFGATGNGTTNDYPAIWNAITSLGGNSGIVYFPPGNYLLNSTLNLPDSVVLKGATSSQTTLTFNLGGVTGNCINIAKAQPHPFYPIQSGYEKGSVKITCDSAMNFSAGDYAEIHEENGSWDTNPAFWAYYSVGQMVKVVAIDADTIFIEHPLRIDYDSLLNVEIRKVNLRANVGIECMHMLRTDSTATNVNYGIYFYYAGNVLIRGVEMERTIGALICAEFSTALEITGNYFHHAYEYTGSNTRGYGVIMAMHTGESKIENNIFRHLRHSMMAKQGANGNVYAYNYSIEPNRSEFPSDYGADISLHGHYPFANLFEGNICQNLMIDQAYGPSGPYNTFFRNRIELYGIIVSSGSVNTDKNNFVGNDITGTGSFQGQYLITGSGHFTHGNRDNGVIQPSGTGVLNDTSYYLGAQPSFWNITNSFPCIGTPFPLTNQNIPARERYLTGASFTLCGPDINTTGFQEIPGNGLSFTILPNPANEFIVVSSEFPINAGQVRENTKMEITIADIYGKLCLRTPDSQLPTKINISTFPSGVYFVTLGNGKQKIVRKFVKE